MTGSSLDAAYFDGIFESDDDPWDLATSGYEAAKFDHTRSVLADRQYLRALEVGCAHGVLTAQLTSLCNTLFAIDISAKALGRAYDRLGDRPGLSLQRMAFPQEAPDGPFDLIVLSEVAYYWGVDDLGRAAAWMLENVTAGGRTILVHYVGETDYPHSGDDAVEALWSKLGEYFSVVKKDRRGRYRLDLWEKR